MKKILFVLLILSVLFIVSCAPEASDEELKQGLSELSDEDLDTLIEETSDEDDVAVAGQAFLSRRGYTWAERVSRERILVAAQQLKIERLNTELYGCPNCGPDDVVGSTPPDDGVESRSDIETPGEAEGFNPQPEPPAGN